MKEAIQWVCGRSLSRASQIKKNPAARFVEDGIAKHTPSHSETVSERLEYSSV